MRKEMLRIYLDNCCYNRPFDPPSNPTIVFETTAKMLIQGLIVNNKVNLVNSFVVYEELSAIRGKEKHDLILKFLENAKIYLAKDKYNEVLQLSEQIMKTGIKYMDAAHVACSIIAECDYLITVDKRLLKYKSDKIIVITPIEFIRVWEETVND